jgi:hypothetical protein
MAVYPVVHIVDSPEIAFEQAMIAHDAQADGVFIIDHIPTGRGGRDHRIIETFTKIKTAQPDFFVGINYLAYDPLTGYEQTKRYAQKGELSTLPDALWFDDAIDGEKRITYAEDNLRVLRKHREKNGLEHVKFMGGLAFKYTRGYTDDPIEAAKITAQLGPLVDEVVTSGAGTGQAPSPAKLEKMVQAIDGSRLAVASGISTDNLIDYRDILPDLDILVASSIETAPYSGRFVPAKVREFIRSYKALTHQE